MLRATLIVNPAARRAHRLQIQLPAIAALLAGHGYTLDTVETSAEPDSARALALVARESSSLLLAGGGDGTVHGVVQGLIEQDHKPTVALGVVPLGTANALARNLNLPLDPLAAVTKLMTYSPRAVSVGQIESARTARYFVSMAGCGPDGALAHGLAGSARSKTVFGRSAYYAHATRLFFTRRWPAFQVEYRLPGEAVWRRDTAVALMAARLPNLGGLFTRLTRLAALTHPHLHIQLLRPPAQLSFPAWFACAHTGFPNPWLATLDIAELRCTPASASQVYAQADAEPFGPLPIALRVVPDALSLLMPPQLSARTPGGHQ